MNICLGVSLSSLATEPEIADLEKIRLSNIITLEIASGFFYPAFKEKIAMLNAITSCGGLLIASIHASFENTFDLSSDDPETHQTAVNEVRHCLWLASEIGAEFVVVHSSCEPITDEERQHRKENTIQALSKCLDDAQNYAVSIAVELLPRSCIGNHEDELIEIVSTLNSKWLGVCLDVNHLMTRYRELPDIVKKIGENLFTLHLSDYDGIDEKHWMPGDGVIAWSEFLAALEEISYSGPFNYEANIPADSLTTKIATLEDNYSVNFCKLKGFGLPRMHE